MLFPLDFEDFIQDEKELEKIKKLNYYANLFLLIVLIFFLFVLGSSFLYDSLFLK